MFIYVSLLSSWRVSIEMTACFDTIILDSI